MVTPTDAQFSFVLSAVAIEGATAFTPAELAPFYADYLAKTVTNVEVEKIAQTITKAYRDAGYVFSQADAPVQDVLAGVLRIKVTEGYVERIEYADDVSGNSVVGSYMAPVLAERPTRLATIERALLLINDLPDVAIGDTSVADGSEDGGKVLKVALDYSAVNADFYMDNRGTPSSGRLQAWTSAAANGLFGVGNRLQFGVFTVPDKPQELIYLQTKWSQPIGPWGTTVEASVSGSQSNAGADLEDSDTESDSFRVHLTLRHPIIRTRNDSLWLLGELDYYDVNEDVSNAVSYQDRNRTARIGLEYYRSDLLAGDFYAKAAYDRGFDVMGAKNSQLSRSDGERQFNLVTLELRRLQKLWGGFGLYLQAKGQWASKPVLSGAEFSVGGSQYGRAYDYGEIAGDQGAAGSVELRYTGENPTDWLDSYDLYAFYDGGVVWDAGVERQVITSAGGGLRATFALGFYGDVQVAKPLNHEVSTESDKDLRVLFSLGAGL